MKQLSCAQCRARWDELISKSTFEADTLEMAEVAAHLESCAECRNAFELLSAARQEMQQLPAQKAPASLRASIRSQITEQPTHSSWLNSLAMFFRSPQRVAWAGSAALAIFLVAFLMRPEHQNAVLQDTSKVLSNRDQVTLQNQQHDDEAKNDDAKDHEVKTTPQATPQKPQQPSSKPTQKAASQEQTKATRHKHSATSKRPRRAPGAKPTPFVPRPRPKTAIAPKPQTSKSTQQPTPTKEPPQENATEPPVVERYSTPAAATTKAAEDTSSTPPPAPAPQAELADANKGAAAPAFSAKGPSGPPGRNSQRMQKTASGVISWHQQITAKSDVAHAEIYAELDPALSFADTSNDNAPKRLVWKGAMQTGQKITLALSLRANEQSADQQKPFVHLTVIDADNEKVLWKDKFEVSQKADR